MSKVDTKFVNTLFLKNLLESRFDEINVKIKTFSIEPVGRDQFNTIRSSMNQIKVKYSSQKSHDKDVTFVAKIKPVSGDLTDEYKNCDVFDKESEMYRNVLPSIGDALKKVGEKIVIAPQ